MKLRNTYPAIAVLATASALLPGGCRESERHFVPAPPPQRDAAVVSEPEPGASGDGGAASAAATTGSGDYPVDAELSRARTEELLAFLENELPADTGDAQLFTSLAQKCGGMPECVSPECGKVLSSCTGDDRAGCGALLLDRCPAFQTTAEGASGDLGAKTDRWVRDLWGDMVVKLRLSLPDEMHGKLDELAQRHDL